MNHWAEFKRDEKKIFNLNGIFIRIISHKINYDLIQKI